MFVVPCGSWTLVQNRARWPPPGPFSVIRPKLLRSLLFGGIDPVTIVGVSSFSSVPLPNASSLFPLSASKVISTSGRPLNSKSLPTRWSGAAHILGAAFVDEMYTADVAVMMVATARAIGAFRCLKCLLSRT